MLVIKKRTIPIWNVLLFIQLSLLYLYVLNSILVQKTSLNLAALLQFYFENKFFFIFSIMLSFVVYLEMKFSKYLFLLFIGICQFYLIDMLLTEFDKLVFIGCIILILLDYYYYLFLIQEFNRPILNPNYSYGQLDITPRYRLEIQLKGNDCDLVNGVITNWSENQCFILLEEALPKSFNTKTELHLISILKGKSFEFKGRLFTHTKDMMGLGFNINVNNTDNTLKMNELGWKEFYICLDELGFIPNLIL